MDLLKIAGGIGCDLVSGTSEFTARKGKIFAIIGNEDDSRILSIKERRSETVLETVVGTSRTYLSVKRVDRITLTGTSGTASVLNNGITRTATWNAGGLAATAADFVTSHAAAYLAAGTVVTSDGATLIFTSSVAGTDFTGNTTITNATGDLAGTVVMNSVANVKASINNGKMIIPDFPVEKFTPAKGTFWVYYIN